MFSMLTLGFVVFLLLVAGSFVVTLMPVPVSTQGGRADQRGVHGAPFVPAEFETAHGESTYPFVLCDLNEHAGDELSDEQLLENEYESQEELHHPSIFTSNSAEEPMKEAA